MQCINCDRTFLDEERLASISGSIMGDEHTDVYYLCPVCRMYTIASWWDNFTGVESMNLSGPIEQQEGDDRVALIRTCVCPWDKKCRCETHRRYFNDTLD
jgi:hypothetical protein